jgi:hypothetical protein
MPDWGCSAGRVPAEKGGTHETLPSWDRSPPGHEARASVVKDHNFPNDCRRFRRLDSAMRRI